MLICSKVLISHYKVKLYCRGVHKVFITATFLILCRQRYTDPQNQKVVRTLIMETKGQDCTISATQVQGIIVCIIRTTVALLQLFPYPSDAARTFFQSRLQQQSLKAKGKYSDKVAYQRRRNRLLKVHLRNLSF